MVDRRMRTSDVGSVDVKKAVYESNASDLETRFRAGERLLQQAFKTKTGKVLRDFLIDGKTFLRNDILAAIGS